MNTATQNITGTLMRLLTSLDEGLRILTSGTGDKACRPDVIRSKGERKKSTTVLSVGAEAYIDRSAAM